MDSEFATGAVRSADADSLDFMSISPIAMIALAKTCQEGAVKYGHHNWELGMPTSDLLNHVHRHLALWEAGDRSEPHLPHALWGLHAAVHMDTLHPELSAARTRGPGCSVTPAMREYLAKGMADRALQRKAGAFAALGRWVLRQVAEIRLILGPDSPPPAPDATEDLNGTFLAVDRDDLAPGEHEVYRGTIVERGPLADRMAGGFRRAGITDGDIFGEDAPTPEEHARNQGEPALIDLDDEEDAEWAQDQREDPPHDGFRPAFEKLPRK